MDCRTGSTIWATRRSTTSSTQGGAMWCLPSFNRPDQCGALIEQMQSLGISTPGILFVNGGDHDAYRRIELPEGWDFHFQESNIGCNAPLNEVFKRFPDEPW